MDDLTKQLRECIEDCRSLEPEMTVRTIADAFKQRYPEFMDEWKDELLDNAIANKVRQLLQRLEVTGDQQMTLSGVEFPTYLCVKGSSGNNIWLHVDDANITHWRSWLDISARNRAAVDAAHVKRQELVDFMEAITNGDTEITTRQAVALFVERKGAA